MKPFKKHELQGLAIIIFVIFFVTMLNIRVAIRRSRDAQRKDDLGSISNALMEFYEDYGFFPPSTDDGKIRACKAENYNDVIADLSDETFSLDKFITGLRGCEWGEDALAELSATSSAEYLKTIPQDPKQKEGVRYLYLSNKDRFQIYAHLEGGKEEEGYNEGIVERNLFCGNYTCNFGKSFSETPLDISIDAYEEKLLREKLE
jgi:hypothetical protein